MRISKLSALLFTVLCCLLMSSQAQAQSAFGYSSVTFDESTNTLTGYASNELDYETAYYYDAEVQAHIEDENGNVVASGTSTGNPTALTVLDVFQAALCIRYLVISYIFVAPHFLGCGGGYFEDFFGFNDFYGGYYYDYYNFISPRNRRCVYTRAILIGTIIADFIRCLPASVSCTVGPTTILPSGLRGIETPYLDRSDLGQSYQDNTTITCTAKNQFEQPMSGLLIRFGFDPNPVVDNGGHQNHTPFTPRVPRPLGTFQPTSMKTEGNGMATTRYTAPIFGGTIKVRITAENTNGGQTADITAQVPGLRELPRPDGNAGYIRTGSSEGRDIYHPNGHYGTPGANTALQRIAAEYRDKLFPNQDVPIDRVLKYNDQSLRLGGKFDIEPGGGVPSFRADGSHDEHRVGINCDIGDSTIPNDRVIVDGRERDRWEVLEDIFCRNGSTRTNREHCRNHWHVRFENGTGCNEENGCRRAANAATSEPARGIAAEVPGRVEVERYDEDANDASGSYAPDSVPHSGGINYHYPRVLPVVGNEENSYVPTSGGQWMNYTVNVPSPGSYTFEARVASPNSGNTFHVEVDGVNVTGSIYIPNTGSGDTYQYVTFDEIWLDTARRLVTLVVEGSGQGKGNFDYFTFYPYIPPQFCQPYSWELQDCNWSGGYWDYNTCQCNYGWYYNY